ncbi:hypothetical protein DICSQDRAFT_126642 [Dichomitus squalens LYAD-421 SS1]|uniref:Uncharacterized protein n=1 Tax=Dichomitus squalens (strain LYAD-421) TaxID=732165 RepID=R7T1Y9_DICSQ|nr:uncharacterized protein DICSQDRAFT_126642 [Dichomitus squalens LYAD-421 SS1]EJF62401.1 hypothetical protein DICSQDRAFT_126642 [Dichomitus squalens LYAD-421 SS1]
MDEGMNVDISVPTEQIVPEETSHHKEPGGDAQKADAELLTILAATQNACLKELGYSPMLLHELQELQKQNAQLQQQCHDVQKHNTMLRDANAKLYLDNRTLATFVQQQEQHRKLLDDPADQQKRTISELHERVRLLTTERDELSRSLHAAFNEIVVLRQELARFVPTATVAPPPPGAALIPLPGTRSAVIHPHVQTVIPASASPAQHCVSSKSAALEGSPDMVASTTWSPHLAAGASGAPRFSSNARASQYNSCAVGHFTSTTPVCPGTVDLRTFRWSRSESIGRFCYQQLFGNVIGRQQSSHACFQSTGHFARPPPCLSPQSTSSSLAGAIIDLTSDDEREDAAKKRKLDHAPAPAAGPSGANASIPAPATSIRQPETVGNLSPTRADIAPQSAMLPRSHPPQQHVVSPTAPVVMSTITYAGQERSGLPPAQRPPLPTAGPVGDVTMMNEGAEQPEEQGTTIEEDCLEANFDEDEADETIKWCRMCRSRQRGGFPEEVPTPFIDAPYQVLIEHCEQVHPKGWEILKARVAEARAAEEAPA